MSKRVSLHVIRYTLSSGRTEKKYFNQKSVALLWAKAYRIVSGDSTIRHMVYAGTAKGFRRAPQSTRKQYDACMSIIRHPEQWT